MAPEIACVRVSMTGFYGEKAFAGKSFHITEWLLCPYAADHMSLLGGGYRSNRLLSRILSLRDSNALTDGLFTE